MPSKKYTGTWTNASSNSYSSGSVKYTNASVEYAFNGIDILLYTIKTPLYGKVNIFIDNIIVGTVDLYSSSSTYKVKVFESNTLNPSNHTIKLVHTGQKNPAASSTMINIDYFEAYSQQ